MAAKIRIQAEALRILARDYETYGQAVDQAGRTARGQLERELEGLLRKYAAYPGVTAKIHEMLSRLRRTEQRIRELRERSEEIGRRLRRGADEYDLQEEKEKQLIRQLQAGLARMKLPALDRAVNAGLRVAHAAFAITGGQLSNKELTRSRVQSVIKGIDRKVSNALTAFREPFTQPVKNLAVTLANVQAPFYRTAVQIREEGAARLKDTVEGIAAFFKRTQDVLADDEQLKANIRELYARIEGSVQTLVGDIHEITKTWRGGNPVIYTDPFVLDARINIDSGVFGGIEGRFYGGDQGWYSQEWQRNSGCGPVAAANLLAHLALSDEKYSALYEYDDLSEKNYTKFMEEVIQTVSPLRIGTLSIGIPSLSSFVKKVEKFAKSKGVELKGQWAENRYGNYDQAVEYIKTGLSADSPVALIIHWNSKWMRDDQLSKFQYHWVTITRIHYNEDEDAYYVTVSSWGKGYTLNFKDIWTSSTYAGIIYFQ